MVKKFGSDVLVPHGYIEIYLHNKWIKRPTFNKIMCEILNVHVLEFDGKPTLYSKFDQTGNQVFMEYMEDYGT
jgi:hypothetical protein